MSKLKAMQGDEKIVARWAGTVMTLALTQDERGRTKLYRKTIFDHAYKAAHIVTGRKANGGPIYSNRPTFEQAHEHALANDCQQVNA